MIDPRASTALHHLPLPGPPPLPWSWAVVAPDPTGRVRLPAAALHALAPGPAHARMVGGVLLLSNSDAPGRPIRIDRRGRCYLPVWLRRPAVLVTTDPVDLLVLIADTAVLDPVRQLLLRAVGA